MANKNKREIKDAAAADLARRAEEILRQNPSVLSERMKNVATPAEMLEVVTNLRIHEIELEMQNEELRRAQVELHDLNLRYFDLYDLAPVGYLSLSQQGQILQANLTAAKLFGVARRALACGPAVPRRWTPAVTLSSLGLLGEARGGRPAPLETRRAETQNSVT